MTMWWVVTNEYKRPWQVVAAPSREEAIESFHCLDLWRSGHDLREPDDQERSKILERILAEDVPPKRYPYSELAL